MSWAFAARVGDMRQVEAKHLRLPPNNNRLMPTTVTFKKGKGGAFWGAYTIHAVLPIDTWKDMAELVKIRRNAPSLWTTTDQRKLSSMVNENGITLRSIRRGALLHNAHRGVSDSDLQYLSGHKRIDTLMRYLGWGVESSSAKEAAQTRHALVGAGEPVAVEPKKMGSHSGFQGTKGCRDEKPPAKFCIRPPSSNQLGMKVNAKKLEIHVKKVGLANIEEIEKMASQSHRFGKACMHALEHLKAEKFREYDKELTMPVKAKLPKAGFSKKQLEKMIEYEKLTPLGTRRGKSYVKGFPIADGHKPRARALGEPHLNAYAEPGKDYPTLRYTSRLENYSKMAGAKFVAQFDYAAYFDQFGLPPEVQEYMVMKTAPVKGNDLWTLTRLPMGATFSPAIAQYTTWVICDPLHDIPGVRVTTMIDNVRIVADSQDAFIMAVQMFLERSDRAGLTLNDDALPYRTKNKRKLAELGANNTKKDFEFLGVCYNNDTICNTERLMEKLKHTKNSLLDEKITHITQRKMAHLLGLLIYMAHTVNISMADHFQLMKIHHNMFQGTPDWDAKRELTESLRTHAKELITKLEKNEKRKIPIPSRPSTSIDDYDAVVVFDACKDAWAAKIHDVKTNETIKILKRFKKQIKHSAHAEPTAAKEIIEWLKKERNYKKIALVTDHKALAMGQTRWWTGFGGHSTAFHINEAFKMINGFAEVFFVEGSKNNCDQDSRSKEARNSKDYLILPCTESWGTLDEYEHPYADERRGFIFF